MHVNKRFGRKIPLPSTMEIRRDLELMTQADMIVKAFKARSATKEEFAMLLSDLIDKSVLSASRARMLRDHYQRNGPDIAHAG